MLGLQERPAQAFPGSVRPPLLLLLSDQHPEVLRAAGGQRGSPRGCVVQGGGSRQARTRRECSLMAEVRCQREHEVSNRRGWVDWALWTLVGAVK